MNDTKKATKRSAGFTAAEKEAMKERAKELKAAKTREEAERDLLAKIAEMPESDRVMGEAIHALIKKAAPQLSPKLWYGMPAYYRNGKVLCFFQAADKFKARYATFGFDAEANLDEGSMWATSWALTKLTKADEERIAALVKRAVG